jgi:Flp pilus assembly protein TadD
VAHRKRAPKAAPLVRPATHPPNLRARAFAAIGLAAITLFVFLPVRRFDFVNWDDPTYLTDNSQVQGGLSWSNVRWALTTTHAPYWHPMTWLSHMLDVTLYGMDPGLHHVTSLVIHLANVLLLFAIVLRMTRSQGLSAFVAAIFAVHPLHVESVAWLAERKDVLSTFFLMLTIWTYLRYVERPGAARYAAIVCMYALALMSKPMVVTLPFALLLLDVWPLRRVGRREGVRYVRAVDASDGAPAFMPASAARLILEKLPLLGLAAATSAATVIVQKQLGAVAGLNALPPGARIATALVGYVAYVWKTVWPAPLAAFYPQTTEPLWLVLLAAAALVVVTAAAIRWRGSRPYLFVGWLWYLVTVAPVIGLMQAGEQAMADRFMYVPMIGLLFIAAWGGRELLDRAGLVPRAIQIIALTLIVALAVTARAQTLQWSDSVTLWRHAARVTEHNYIAYENLGQALRERGDLEEARMNYEQALRLAPQQSPGYEAVIHNSLGLVLTRQGKLDDAEREFADAARLSPNFAEAQNNYANALAGSGQFGDAIVHYRAALAIQPGFTDALVGLGGTLVSEGRAGEAEAPYRDALRLDPDLAEAHNGLGGALAVEHRDAEAMDELTRALALKPDLPSAHLNIAILLLRKQDLAGARAQLETALSIDPSYQPARNALAQLK